MLMPIFSVHHLGSVFEESLSPVSAYSNTASLVTALPLQSQVSTTSFVPGSF